MAVRRSGIGRTIGRCGWQIRDWNSGVLFWKVGQQDRQRMFDPFWVRCADLAVDVRVWAHVFYETPAQNALTCDLIRRRFKNILVGVDLSQTDRFVSSELPPPSVEAVECALWLAKLNSARLTFFNALDVSAAAQQMIDESDGGKENVLEEAQDVLKGLVARAVADGVTADVQVRFGKSWLELVRQVLQNEHDLLVAGTRHQGAWQGLLMRSTGIKLLRKCPCPVWITQPQAEREFKSILVAHDLRSVGDLAMELGRSMAELHGAQLHVLHSLEFPELDHALPVRVSAETSAELRATAEQHINAQLAKYEFAKPPQVDIVTDAPDFAILEHVDKDAVELLVMGTIARTGSNAHEITSP